MLGFELHSQLAAEHNGAELWGYRRVRCGQLTAVGHSMVVNSQGNSEGTAWSESNATIQLEKWWAGEQRSSSVLPNDLDWFKARSVQSYEELADTTSTAQVHPSQFTVAVANLAERAGARIIFGTVEHINCTDKEGAPESTVPITSCHDWSQKKIVSVEYTDKVTSKKHNFPATTVVLAAGPWTSTLLPNLHMSPLRAHSISIKVSRPISAYCLFTQITMKNAPELGMNGLLSTSSSVKTISPEIYSRPDNEIYICGQGDVNVPLPSPTEVVAVSEQRCQDIVAAAASISDEIARGQVTGRRACYLPVVDSSLSKNPLIGQTGLEGLLLATGHSCWGILHAPATGKAISELIFDGEVSCMQPGNLDPRTIIFKRNEHIS